MPGELGQYCDDRSPCMQLTVCDKQALNYNGYFHPMIPQIVQYANSCRVHKF